MDYDDFTLAMEYGLAPAELADDHLPDDRLMVASREDFRMTADEWTHIYGCRVCFSTFAAVLRYALDRQSRGNLN